MKKPEPSKFKGKALLKGKKCVVTGGALGIGAQICYTFAENEAEVIILDYNREAAENTKSFITAAVENSKVHFVQADVSDRAGLKKSFDEVASICDGSIDVFVNNVGIIQPCRIEDIISDEESKTFDRIIDVNIKGTYYCAAYAYPLLVNEARELELLSTIFYSCIIISGMYAFHNERRFLILSSAIFIIAVILEWLQFFIAGHFLNSIQPLTTSIVLILLLVLTLKNIMVAKVVDQNVIFGVVSGYILIGFIGGLLAIAVAWSFPDAFNVAGIIDGPQAMYFSFITMTTLGYGDITPAIQETRSLAILLSIVGPMYVAIIVALMVGKFAARQD